MGAKHLEASDLEQTFDPGHPPEQRHALFAVITVVYRATRR